MIWMYLGDVMAYPMARLNTADLSEAQREAALKTRTASRRKAPVPMGGRRGAGEVFGEEK